MALAKEKSLGFGVKLTNTLGTINNKGALPGEEMYMSGRALFRSPSTLQQFSRAFDGKLPISYSGGASQLTIRDIFDTGIRPITMATDLLKPGGYLRLSACMRELEGSDAWELNHVDVERLNRLAADALTMEYTQKHWKPEERIEVAEDLPLTDCYVAPVLLPALSSKIFRNTSVCLANTAMPTRWNSSINATPCPPLPVIFAITSANTTVPAWITTVR